MSIVDIVSDLTENILADEKPKVCWLCEREVISGPYINVCDSCMSRKELWDKIEYLVTDE